MVDDVNSSFPVKKPAVLVDDVKKQDDSWALWPDDYMCPWGELEAHIRGGRSDDVQKVVVLDYDGTGSPSVWAPVRKGSL